MDAPRFQGGGEVEPFCNEVLRECTARRFTGVVCRFGSHPAPALAQLAGQVAQVCAGRGLECFVSEGCGDAAPQGTVVIPTALSGGSLRRRLEEAVEQFGRGRVALWVDRVAQDFTLPAPTGEGERLSVAELARRREELGRAVFFSDELCAHYFTYMVGETGHFVLFDDAGSVRKKLRLAAGLGVNTAFLAYEECEDLLGELTGR